MYEFEVKDLSCGHCVRTVAEAIRQQDRSATVRVELSSKRVKVETTAAESTLRKALAQAGYPAT